jgi:hypothetical protein
LGFWGFRVLGNLLISLVEMKGVFTFPPVKNITY